MLLASSHPASAPKNSKLTVSGPSFRELESNTPTTRFFDTVPTNEGEDVERSISVKLPSLEQISNTFKSRKTKELQGLFKTDDSIGNAFKRLKMNTMLIGNANTGYTETEKVVKLFSSTNFKIWLKHITKLNAQNPEAAILTALTDIFGEKSVATMILLFKD